ncbi:MAG TPA: hypothetical protein VJN90_03200, partial [Candidatus Acidoferrales bacterium]|nr:hypothetical protein [Candidatus Acidoferrales bacterium]
ICRLASRHGTVLKSAPTRKRHWRPYSEICREISWPRAGRAYAYDFSFMSNGNAEEHLRFGHIAGPPL